MHRLITTSWDDGHETDFRLAELLHKYGLKATFYIPKANRERPVMLPSQIQDLANVFEVGAHTLQHQRLHKAGADVLNREINGSYQWLADITGKAPVSFCFPGGKYNQQAINQAFASGFKVLRTTELLRTSSCAGIVPTTLQLYPHATSTYLKHLVKRRRWNDVIKWLKTSSSASLETLTDFYLKQVERDGGCFHLWGHSWEIEENNLWKKLEAVFSLLANRPAFSYIENKDLLHYSGS